MQPFLTEILFLTPTKVEEKGTTKTFSGVLPRFFIDTAEGVSGQYWPKDRANVATWFIIGQRKKYRVEHFHNNDGTTLIKLSPARKEDIVTQPIQPTRLVIDTEMNATRPPVTGRAIAVQPSGVDPALAAAALDASIKLAIAGKIEMSQIPASAKKFTHILQHIDE